MSYIGQKGAERLDPGGCFSLATAEGMARAGDEAACIKAETGWEKGADGFWRYEIADPFIDSDTIDAFVRPRFGEKINIRLILRDCQILEAYPEFEDLTLYAIYSPRRGVAGYYNPDTNGIVVSMGSPSDSFDYRIEGVLLHEIQHLIQQIEGFAKGGNVRQWGRDRYLRLAGEVEARNICHRHFLTPDERRRKLRTETQDIPDPRQIVIFR